MPIPNPRPNESQSDFISRCVSALADSDPDMPNLQRVAVCFSTWRKSKGVKKMEQPCPGSKKKSKGKGRGKGRGKKKGPIGVPWKELEDEEYMDIS